MLRATNRGGRSGDWSIETDEAPVLDYLRGLPDPGSGFPWSRALDGQPKAESAIFEVDPEAALTAQQLQAAPHGRWEEGRADQSSIARGARTPRRA